MKIIDLPTRLFETGDRVLTPEGPGTVVHDELEGIFDEYPDAKSCNGLSVFDKPGKDIRKDVAEHSHERDVVIVRLDKPNSDDRQEIELNRHDLVYPLEV